MDQMAACEQGDGAVVAMDRRVGLGAVDGVARTVVRDAGGLVGEAGAGGVSVASGTCVALSMCVALGNAGAMPVAAALVT